MTSNAAKTPDAPASSAGLWRVWILVPLLVLAALAAVVLRNGDALIENLGSNPPPADAFVIQRAEFHEGEIRINVVNPQRDELTIGAVMIDDAIMPYSVDGPKAMDRLDRRTITVPYSWLADEPYLIGVTSSSGVETAFEVPAAVEWRGVSGLGLWTCLLVGLLVGVIPVGLGLLWLPALRRASEAWLGTFMALTAGLLSFLAIDALEEALELQARLPGGTGGLGLVLVSVAASWLALSWVSHRFSRAGSEEAGAGVLAPAQLALLVAIGIGLHNLGEGLAIGASFALGELTLGLALIVGFMVHNVTEGLGIAVPLARRGATLTRLVALAFVAGSPAIIGVVLGRYIVSDLMGVIFFGLAVGAALQVVVEVMRYVRRSSPGNRMVTGRTALGFVAGLAIMYATGLLAS